MLGNRILALTSVNNITYVYIPPVNGSNSIVMNWTHNNIPPLISNDFYLSIRTYINMGIILFGCLDAEPHFSCTLFGYESEIDTLSLEKRSIIISLYVGIHIAQKHVGLDTRTRCTHRIGRRWFTRNRYTYVVYNAHGIRII